MRGGKTEYSKMSDADGGAIVTGEEEKPPPTFMDSCNAMTFTGPLNILLICVPIACVSYYGGFPDPITFIFSLLGLAPLAERLGFVTEQLALHTNETIGGLLNATFGNLTELIVAITALNRGLYRLVQLSLLGSVLSNMLLVLGTAFFCGGLYHKTQSFGTISSQMNATLLMLSTMGVLFPTVLTMSGEESSLGQLGFSRATSLILFLIYFAFIYFQLVSHKFLYEERPSPDVDPDDAVDDAVESGKSKQSKKRDVEEGGRTSAVESSLAATTAAAMAASSTVISPRSHPMGTPNEEEVDAATHPHGAPFAGKRPSLTKQVSDRSYSSRGSSFSSSDGDISPPIGILGGGVPSRPTTPKTILEAEKETSDEDGDDGDDDDDDDEEEDLLGFWNAMFWLGVMTVLIAVLSDAISGTIQDAADSAGISGIFIAAIVLPIVGNAAEHAGAVMFAMKGKLDLSLGVAIGSSTQIALCVLPLIVLIGWALDKDMDLNFGAYEGASLLLSVVSVTFAIKDGHSNWLLGATLIAAYFVISVGFWAHKNDKLD